ncbi:hypothetical protein YC2023_112197 [Brassica napus]
MSRLHVQIDGSAGKKIGGMKLEELPVLDALMLSGTSHACCPVQTRVVREGDSGIASAWNMKDQRSNKIGEVVDGPESRCQDTRFASSWSNSTSYGQDSEIFSLPPQLSSRASDF